MKKLNTFLNVFLAIFFVINVVISKAQTFGLNFGILNSLSLYLLFVFGVLRLITFLINLITNSKQQINQLQQFLNVIKAKIENLQGIKHIFLFSLFIYSLISFDYPSFEFLQQIPINLEFVKQYEPFFFIFILASGFFTFYKHREEIQQKTEEEYKKEKAKEKKRAQEFSEGFKLLSKIPLVNKVSKWIYREGTLTALGLLAILTVFVVIKLPYMNLPFTGRHEMKYSAIVEPAKHMLKHGPFWYQKKYKAVPRVNPNGIYNSFSNYPLMEWGLLSTFKLFPNNTIELNTRLYTAFLGIIFLIIAYCLVRKFISKKSALLSIFLLATNVIIQFFTYVTVMDTLMVIFFFLSLIFLLSGFKKDKPSLIYLAGILGGIGVNLKYNLLIFGTITYLLIFLEWKDIGKIKRIIYSLFFFPFLILETVFFKKSLGLMPNRSIFFGTVFLLVILLHFLILAFQNRVTNFVQVKLAELTTKKIIGIVVTIIFFSGLVAVRQFDWILNFRKEFLTDKYLILNWPMYKRFFNMWSSSITSLGIYLAFLGFLVVNFILKETRVKLIINSFVVSSLFYLIIASKVLYFHQYYHHLFMITLLLSSGVLIYSLTKIFNKYFSIFIVLTLTIPIITKSYMKTKKWLSRGDNNGIKNVSSYVHENMPNRNIFLRTGPAALSFYSNRKSFNEFRFKANAALRRSFREEFSKKGILKTLKKYGIQYYVTEGEENFNRTGFGYILNPSLIKSQEVESFRTLKIRCVENNECFFQKEANQEVIFDSFEKRIRSLLTFEKRFGNYYVYSFY